MHPYYSVSCGRRVHVAHCCSGTAVRLYRRSQVDDVAVLILP
eukprot:COSAG05_NODE_9477_length_621_cov_12.000000_1_plen_41_part_01